MLVFTCFDSCAHDIFDLLDRGYNQKLATALSSGIDINTKNDFGMTPLMRAVQIRNVDAMQLLFEYDVNVNSEDIGGDTAMHIAARNNDLKSLSMLINHGANINVINKDGTTPIEYAIANQNLIMIKAMRDSGAELSQKDIQELLSINVTGHDMAQIQHIVGSVRDSKKLHNVRNIYQTSTKIPGIDTEDFSSSVEDIFIPQAKKHDISRGIIYHASSQKSTTLHTNAVKDSHLGICRVMHFDTCQNIKLTDIESRN